MFESKLGNVCRVLVFFLFYCVRQFTAVFVKSWKKILSKVYWLCMLTTLRFNYKVMESS